MNGENKRCHLNMIQQVITRMRNNSFALKGWSVGMMIAIYAFASQNSHKAVVVTLIPLIVFWFLDSYYLTLERKFRALYDDVRLRVKQLRLDNNKTQDEIAKYLNVDKSTYNKYENGKRKFNNDVVKELAEYYNIKVSDIVD